MRTGFVLRFDDLCPTASWQIWNRIEEMLVEFGLTPIVSVIPDNRESTPPSAGLQGIRLYWAGHRYHRN
jgi:Uncharacterized protein conserved in bacteria (DUF2334)